MFKISDIEQDYNWYQSNSYTVTVIVGDRSWSYLFALQIATEIKLVQTQKIGYRRWSGVCFRAMIETEIRLVNGSKLTRWSKVIR